MKKIAIVDGIRTPFIKSWTSFDGLTAQRLGALCAREVLERTLIDPDLIDEVIFGCVGQPADAANIARVISLYAGIPESKKAYTVSRNCASGFESVTSAVEKICYGADDIVIAGGTESMSNAPFFLGKDIASILMELQRSKTPIQKIQTLSKIRLKHLMPIPALKLGLADPVCGLNMGQTAEVLAKDFGLTRCKQDEFALKSHHKAIAAKEKLAEEIMPIHIPPHYKEIAVADNGPRENQTMEALAKLPPVFERGTGTVTPGNASQITDGASALLLMEEARAKEMGYDVLGSIRAFSYAGCDPKRMGLGPVFATDKVLRMAGLTLKDMELIEINEAFAVQVLSCLKAFGSKEFASHYLPDTNLVCDIDPNIVNVNGGAIALGHPVGTSGTRLILTCLKEMKRRSLHLGLVTLCIGGGQGGAIILEVNP